jgi:hypothetical protein
MVYEIKANQHKIFIIHVKLFPILAFRWYCIDCFSLIEKVSCCVRVCQKTRYEKARNQVANGKDEAINPKEGEGEAKNVERSHTSHRPDRQARRPIYIFYEVSVHWHTKLKCQW